jgi:hypothetical protein
MTTREERREANRLKNERRREKNQHTVHAAQGREYRRFNGGAFGKADPETFNLLAEGTSAMRRSEAPPERATEWEDLW